MGGARWLEIGTAVILRLDGAQGTPGRSGNMSLKKSLGKGGGGGGGSSSPSSLILRFLMTRSRGPLSMGCSGSWAKAPKSPGQRCGKKSGNGDKEGLLSGEAGFGVQALPQQRFMEKSRITPRWPGAAAGLEESGSPWVCPNKPSLRGGPTWKGFGGN